MRRVHGHVKCAFHKQSNVADEYLCICSRDLLPAAVLRNTNNYWQINTHQESRELLKFDVLNVTNYVHTFMTEFPGKRRTRSGL